MVRVATLNLLNNAYGRWPERAPLVVDQARRLDADVYAFQEVDARSRQIERIVDAVGTGYEAAVLANPDPGSIKSLAIVTRLPIAGRHELTSLEQGDLALRVDVDARGTAPLRVVTTHFHFSPSRQGSARRRRQAEQLLEWLSHEGPARPTVVLGDFNSKDGGAAVCTMKEHFRSSHEVANGREPQSTHPTPLVHALDTQRAFGLPVFPEGGGAAIDYVFVDETITVERCELAWTEPSAGEPNLYPSDHFGLVADLSVP